MYILINPLNANPVTPYRVTEAQYNALGVHQQSLYQLEAEDDAPIIDPNLGEALSTVSITDGGIVGNDEPQSEIPTSPFGVFGGGESGGAGATEEWEAPKEGNGNETSKAQPEQEQENSSNDGEAMQSDDN
jgi:hypothetical protein